MDEEETVWEGRYIAAKRRGRWEWAARTRSIGAAVILAVEDGAVLLVEQHRVPLGRRTIELPAGLVGDDIAGESIEASAVRELEEETGWRTAKIEMIGEFASSPGMVSETFTLVRASGLTRIGDGGGVAGEDIIVHHVRLADLIEFLADKRHGGVVIDAKLLVLLGPLLPGLL